MKKNYLIISQYFTPEIGMGSFRITNIFKILKKNNNVRVITKRPSYPDVKLYKQKHKEDNNIIRVKSYIGNKKIKEYVSFLCYSIKKILKTKNKYDIIFISSPPIFIMILGIIAKYKFKAKLILDVRDLWPDSIIATGKVKYKFLLAPLYLLEKITYASADKIIYNSKGFEKRLNKYKDKTIYIPNGFTEKEIEERSYKKQKTKYFTIGYSGNIGLAQDMSPFLKLAENYKNNKKIRFIVYGFGEKLEIFKNEIKNKKLINIDIYPAKNRNKIIEKIGKFDMGFFSLEKNKVFETVIPGKILDYISLGIPIIGCGAGNIKQVSNNYNGFDVFDHKNLAEMIDIVDRYLKGEKLFSMSEYKENIEKLKKEFNWDRNMKKLEEEVEKWNF